MSAAKKKPAAAAKKPVKAKPAAKKPTPKKAAPKPVPAKKAAAKPLQVAKPAVKPISQPRAAAPLEVVPAKKAKPLAKQLLEHFRKKLVAEKQRVLEEMGEQTSSTFMKSISEEAGENSRYSYHLGDVASLSYGREFSMGLAERQQNYLEQIDDALQRIEDGTYGICKVTGEQIPTERLEEVPVAKYSVRGKEILSHRQRHSADERRAAAVEERMRRSEPEEGSGGGDDDNS